ncbi:hypothetical protein VC596_22210 [Citrobacter freundii]|uniref:Uncharacterized protein n=1 Tax=Klebsiella quasipneumoniae subsp. quasipneumoniae TaxID=1667327 RepID=A0AAW8XZF7_9ENTR|nr:MULTISPECIES: hypothetical protein [Enterobacteriaceae]ECI0582124.1 hypothetical protein [Salmonella enterica subsp. enterica serovar Newport]EDF4731350.1 hypothetical protein [Salmonella enterica]EFJ8509047.1 hypothetical protein [Escherichia coli]EHG9814730.1 hypothetical protein [Salmonella enterica subsp. enterica serovar Enteritidis]EKD7209802.1 hypothetical protein [Salmonella enterica subsp. enterica serovar Liverpool]
MGRNIESKSFVSIWKEVKSYTCTVNETETFEMLLLVMAGRGFKFSKHEFIILSTRGQMRSQKVNRCSLHKKFFYKSVEEKMKTVFMALKQIHDKNELERNRLLNGRDKIISRFNRIKTFNSIWKELIELEITTDEIDSYECLIFIMKDRKIKIPDSALAAMELTAFNSLKKKKLYRETKSIPFELDSIREELNNIYNLLTDNIKYDKFQTIHTI